VHQNGQFAELTYDVTGSQASRPRGPSAEG
jgi:hypothetical protein